jgi:uncharacterized protein YjbI with pentapeptide repeats
MDKNKLDHDSPLIIQNQHFEKVHLLGKIFGSCSFQNCTFNNFNASKAKFSSCHFEDCKITNSDMRRRKLNSFKKLSQTRGGKGIGKCKNLDSEKMYLFSS